MRTGKRLVTGAAALAFIALAGCEKVSEAAKASAAENSAAPASSHLRSRSAPETASDWPAWTKPQALVSFPKGMMACRSTEELQDALQEGAGGRERALNSHFANAARAGDECITIQPNTPVRVLSASYDPMIGMGVIKLAGEGVTTDDQAAYAMVVDDSFVRLVQAPS